MQFGKPCSFEEASRGFEKLASRVFRCQNHSGGDLLNLFCLAQQNPQLQEHTHQQQQQSNLAIREVSNSQMTTSQSVISRKRQFHRLISEATPKDYQNLNHFAVAKFGQPST